MHKTIVHAQESCACTTLLGMHNTLVRALGQGTQGPGTKPGARDQAWDPKRQLGRSQALDRRVVHAQESCACTRILCMYYACRTCSKPKYETQTMVSENMKIRARNSTE